MQALRRCPSRLPVGSHNPPSLDSDNLSPPDQGMPVLRRCPSRLPVDGLSSVQDVEDELTRPRRAQPIVVAPASDELVSLDRLSEWRPDDGSGSRLECSTDHSTRLLDGDVVRSACDTANLLPLYLETRPPADDNPWGDLEALPMYTRERPRRSARVPTASRSLVPLRSSPGPPPPVLGKRPRRAVGDDVAPSPREVKKRKWIEPNGSLKTPNAAWSSVPSTTPSASSPPTHSVLPERANGRPDSSPKSTPLNEARSESSGSIPKRPGKSHARPSKNCKTRRGKPRDDKLHQRAVDRGDVHTAASFSLVHDSSRSDAGWQGGLPPKEARAMIDHDFHCDRQALIRHIARFHPAEYYTQPKIRDERGTFFADRTGRIFMYRSFRAEWLMELADEVEEAHDILVGEDTNNADLESKYHDGLRGPHMAIIIGHQRQSAVRPYLTAWHREHQDRVDKFMSLPIVGRIIRYITIVVTIIFPALARRFKEDAEWHETRYGIKPMFGLFWNLCLNAWFKGQRRIHCGPHADKKNQVGICLLLIYVLKSGKNFNHRQRTWLVLWEAAVAVQLPPWVIAMYPSALFYHFNIDVHDIRFVTTEGDERPTRENSTPVVEGDDCGRGSFVFFNQSTMRHGPVTGFDTVEEATANGHSGVVDFGTSVQEAFERHVVLRPVDESMLNA